jgi:hypothetical protein
VCRRTRVEGVIPSASYAPRSHRSYVVIRLRPCSARHEHAWHLHAMSLTAVAVAACQCQVAGCWVPSTAVFLIICCKQCLGIKVACSTHQARKTHMHTLILLLSRELPLAAASTAQLHMADVPCLPQRQQDPSMHSSHHGACDLGKHGPTQIKGQPFGQTACQQQQTSQSTSLRHTLAAAAKWLSPPKHLQPCNLLQG